MNRQLKFRAWNGEAMEYGGFSIHASGNNHASLISPLSRVTKDSPVMQFTGLKDKNGKDIYEGDILKVIEDGDFRCNHVVKYSDCGYWINVEGDYDLTTLSFAIDNFYYSYEVIGNIYQNPELLAET